MYKKQADPIFFPAGTNILPRVFFRLQTFWPPDPLNKGKMDFYCNFELPEALTTRIKKKNLQNPSKKAKNTAAGTNILPQKAKVLLFPPPLHTETCLL